MDCYELNKKYDESLFEWKIKNFLEMATRPSQPPIQDSPIFCFAGASWQMTLAKSITFRTPEGLFNKYEIHLSIMENEKDYNVEVDLGILRVDGKVQRLGKGIYLFPKDLKVGKGLSSVQMGIINIKEMGKKSEQLLPMDILTLQLSLRIETFDQPETDSKNLPKELQGFKAMSQQFGNLLYSGIHTDTTLFVKDTQYRAHRAVLCARSPVFAAMFAHETSERLTGIINISDSDPNIFQMFLEFLYTGKLQEQSAVSALRLYEVADKYAVEDLKKFSLTYIMGNLDEESFLDALIIAARFQESELLCSCRHFFNENQSAILSKSQLNDFLKKNSYLAELLD